jgi:hypothetical protein
VCLDSSLDAYNLAQCVNDFHQVSLSGHNGLDRLVSGWSLVDHVGIFPAFDAGRHSLMIRHGKSPLCFPTRHGTPRAMAAAIEAFRIALSTHDIGTSPHTSGNNSHVAFAGTDGSLASDQNVLAIEIPAPHNCGDS